MARRKAGLLRHHQIHGRGLRSALLSGAVGLAVTALRQLLGALRAVQLQEAGDEPGDGFHIAGPGAPEGGRLPQERCTQKDHSRSPKPCTSHTRELPTRTQHLPSWSPSSPGPCPALSRWNPLRQAPALPVLMGTPTSPSGGGTPAPASPRSSSRAPPTLGVCCDGQGAQAAALASPSPVLAHLWWPMMALWVRGCEKPVEKRSTTT